MAQGKHSSDFSEGKLPETLLLFLPSGRSFPDSKPGIRITKIISDSRPNGRLSFSAASYQSRLVSATCLASERRLRQLPASSALALVDGAVGFGYHVRGVARRPGGTKNWLYNILYGPPIFAPLLFAACGALGILCQLVAERKTYED